MRDERGLPILAGTTLPERVVEALGRRSAGKEVRLMRSLLGEALGEYNKTLYVLQDISLGHSPRTMRDGAGADARFCAHAVAMDKPCGECIVAAVRNLMLPLPGDPSPGRAVTPPKE